jgi:hypothetical protein
MDHEPDDVATGPQDAEVCRRIEPMGAQAAVGGFETAEVASMLRDQQDQDAFVLLAFLRIHNGPLLTFMCANGLTETFGWWQERLSAARLRLMEIGHIIQVQVQRPHSGSPARYRWG